MSADTFTAPTAPPRDREGTEARETPRRRLRLPASLRLSRTTIAVSLLALVAITVYLRTRGLHFYLWVDEGLSVGIASHPLSQIPSLLRQDGSPPLYYLILHVWMSLRGRSEVSTHELSLLFAVLTIPASYWAGASLFGRRTGLIAAVLAAGAPYLTTYGQETRMYALMALLSVIVAGSFVHSFVYHRRRYLPVFSVSLAAALYTHNWGLFLGLFCAAGFLWCVYATPSAERGRCWRDGLIGFGVVALLFAPWLPNLIYQAQHTGAPWDLPPVLWSLTTAPYFLVGGRGVAMTLLLGGGVGLAAVGILPALVGRRVVPIAGDLDPEAARLRLSAQSLLILGLGTVLFAWAYSKITPAWAPRYFAAVVGPLLLLFALGLSRARRLGMVALAFCACFWLLDPVTHHRDSKSNVASVAHQIKPYLRSDVIVLSTQPEQVPTISYYLPQVRQFATPLGRTPDPHVVDWRDALAKMERPTVHRVLIPLVATLHVGEQVLFVIPLHFPKAPTYMKMINRASAGWSVYLNNSPRLHYVTTAYYQYNKTGQPVQAYLYDVVR
ncbi:MAG: mannosyltransferase [Solirubrobacteraceae bacterium]|nr:mannosyltransferase [Solirubrobacteraceae bacterium]